MTRRGSGRDRDDVDERQLVRPLDRVKIQIGSVWSPAPAVKFVTMISSNDRANASSAPASSAVRIAGHVMRRNVVQRVRAEVGRRLLRRCAAAAAAGR